MDSLSVNVVLLPSPELARKAISTSESLGHLQGVFTLKDGEFFPHVSLYMLQLGRASINDACQLLQAIASSTGPLSLTAYRYDINENP